MLIPCALLVTSWPFRMKWTWLEPLYSLYMTKRSNQIHFEIGPVRSLQRQLPWSWRSKSVMALLRKPEPVLLSKNVRDEYMQSTSFSITAPFAWGSFFCSWSSRSAEGRCSCWWLYAVAQTVVRLQLSFKITGQSLHGRRKRVANSLSWRPGRVKAIIFQMSSTTQNPTGWPKVSVLRPWIPHGPKLRNL